MKLKLPSLISIFPLSGVIFFPETNLPLNIFEPKYLALVNDCMKSNKYMGIIQSKKNSSDVYSIGCLGKITENKKTRDEFPDGIFKNFIFEIKAEMKNLVIYKKALNYLN